MKLPGIVLLTFMIIFSLLANGAADSTFRCRGHIVSVGDTQEEVLIKCGEPDHIKQWEEGGPNLIYQFFDYEHERYIAPKLIVGPLKMERWTYNLGSNKFIRYLKFQNRELIEIETGKKGND